MKKLSLVTIFFTTLFILGAFIVPNPPGNDKPINTDWLDKSIKPGDDFFAYVNAKWIHANPIPATESRWGSFNILDDNSKKTLRTILEDDAKAQATKGTIIQKVGDFWHTGMDSAAIEQQGINPVKSHLTMIESIRSKDEIMRVACVLFKTGATPFFGFYVDADAKNSSMNILTLMQGGLGMPDRDYYLRTDAKTEEIKKAYKAYAQKLFVLAGEDQEDAEDMALTVYQIETELAGASMTRVEQRDPYATYNKMTLDEFISKNGGMNWKIYFAAMGYPAMTELIVAQPKFFEQIDGMMKEEDWDVEDWKTYMKFHVLTNSANLLSSGFEQAHFDFYSKALLGTQEMDPRWKRVSEIADFCLGEALGQEYVKRAFSPEAKQKMIDLVGNLKIAFAQRIDQLDWMSPETKAKAKDKLSKIVVKVGYPDKWRDYSALQIDRGPFVLNVFRCIEFETNRAVAKAGKPVDRGEWLMNPQTVNAYYNPTNNEIVFPAAILQPPFFDPKADNAVNYGGIGAVIGHEITHGFDDQGRQFDADGNLKDWWTEEDGKKFEAKAARVSAYYSAYQPIDTLRINGDLTNGENIADQGGLAIAWTAFMIEQKKNPQTAKIDGLTPEQRFFINYAQIWRSSMRDEMLRMRLVTDPHSPPKYRVLGTLSNTPEWYTVFGVQPGDKMYIKPEERTQIW